MAFCANCGTDIKDARFCPSCGTQAGAAAEPRVESPQPAAQPRTVTVGQVRKCPACGSPVESFQSRCGACGHELNAVEVSGAIKEFTAEINGLDEKIANEKGQPLKASADTSAASGTRTSKPLTSKPLASTLKSGTTGALVGSALSGSSKNKSSSSSVSGKKVAGGFLIVGIFVGAIALIVKVTKNFKAAIARPALSPSEKTKKSYIENFVVPNNREDILEFVLLAASKAEAVIDLGHGETMGEIANAHFWAKVWENKCKKVEDRALITLQGDTETMSHIMKFHDRSKNVYKTITEVKKKRQIKSVIGFILMLFAIVSVTFIVLALLFYFLL